MARILVTGGSGVLGRELAPRLAAAGYTVRVMSRHPRPASAEPALEWATGQIATGEGLGAAVAGADTVIHAASSPFSNTRQVDVDGTRRLVEGARPAGVRHLVYISIVGIDRHPLGYYQAKLAAERLIEQGGVPWTVLRATQFHELIDRALRELARWPLLMLPKDWRFQPVAAAEVAEALVEAAARGPAGRLPDLAGPELWTAGELAETWLAARGQRRRVFHLPLPGRAAAAYRAGLNTAPDRAVGRQRWAEWLAARYGHRNAAQGATQHAPGKQRTESA